MPASERQRYALVVEDDAPIRRLVSTVLGREGFDVDAVADGAAAIQRLGGSKRYAVIVLDLMLPTLGGEEVIAFLRGHMPESVRRIVLITATVRLASFGLPDELCVVLQKPFELDHFVRAVRACAE